MYQTNIEAIFLTVATFVLTISITTVFSVIGSLMAILYWFTKLKNIVTKHYDGSWKSYFKSLIQKK